MYFYWFWGTGSALKANMFKTFRMIFWCIFIDFGVIFLVILMSFWTLGAQGGDPRGPPGTPFWAQVDFRSIFGSPGGSTFDTCWSTWDDRDHNLKSTIITKNMSQFQVMFSRSGGTKKWSKWTPGAPTFQLFSSCTKTMKSTIIVDF